MEKILKTPQYVEFAEISFASPKPDLKIQLIQSFWKVS